MVLPLLYLLSISHCLQLEYEGLTAGFC